ncbi:MAG: hypothetical protein LBD90_08405 [Bifidobacteriaceae bacterium]|nr:hypothetical protein [Bifidobacteriaceae bacterium]
MTEPQPADDRRAGGEDRWIEAEKAGQAGLVARRRASSAAVTINAGVSLISSQPGPGRQAGAAAGRGQGPGRGDQTGRRLGAADCEPVLPSGPDSDSAAAWGELADDGAAALVREVPPHWSGH